MKFNEKIKKLRKDMKLSQGELAKKVGVSGRSIASYEAGTSYPRYRKTYEALARVLGVDVNYLRTEEEEFLEDVEQEFGSRAQRQAVTILSEARQLFAGGELSEKEQLIFLTEMQRLFCDSKQRSKKFTPHIFYPGESEE